MSKAIRTALGLVISLVLFSAIMITHASGQNADTDKKREHHSHLAKLAFWRHHKAADKRAKHGHVTQAPSKRVHVKAAQMKRTSANQATSKGDQKQTQHASKMSKPSPAKAPAANKTKPEPTAASLNQ
jgi:hypothetical protein